MCAVRPSPAIVEVRTDEPDSSAGAWPWWPWWRAGSAYGWQGVVLAVSDHGVLAAAAVQPGAARHAHGCRPPGGFDRQRGDAARQAAARGMKLLQILPLTRSLGQKVADEPETFVWTDGGGDRVRVELRDGRCTAFALERAADAVVDSEAGGQAGAVKSRLPLHSSDPRYPMSMSDRDGKIWMDGQMVDWRDAKIHVLTHTLALRLRRLRGRAGVQHRGRHGHLPAARAHRAACSTAPRSCA